MVSVWRWFWGGFAIGAAIGILRNFTASLQCLGCTVVLILLVALLLFWTYPQVVIGIIVLIIVLRVLVVAKRTPPPGREPLVVAEPEAAIEPALPVPRRKKWEGPYTRRRRRPE